MPNLLFYAGVAAVGPHEAVVASTIGPLLRIKNGAALVETPPADLKGHPISVSVVPGVGTVLGTSQGGIAVDRGSGWTVLDSPAANFVFAAHGYPGGMVLGLAFGGFGQWLSTPPRFCDVQTLASATVLFIAPLGFDLVLFGENPSSANTPVTILSAGN
jgi:hypothetical protein